MEKSNVQGYAAILCMRIVHHVFLRSHRIQGAWTGCLVGEPYCKTQHVPSGSSQPSHISSSPIVQEGVSFQPALETEIQGKLPTNAIHTLIAYPSTSGQSHGTRRNCCIYLNCNIKNLDVWAHPLKSETRWLPCIPRPRTMNCRKFERISGAARLA